MSVASAHKKSTKSHFYLLRYFSSVFGEVTDQTLPPWHCKNLSHPHRQSKAKVFHTFMSFRPWKKCVCRQAGVPAGSSPQSNILTVKMFQPQARDITTSSPKNCHLRVSLPRLTFTCFSRTSFQTPTGRIWANTLLWEKKKKREEDTPVWMVWYVSTLPAAEDFRDRSDAAWN